MARVLHLSTVHPASDPRILEKQAASMAASGHDVTVLPGSQRAQWPGA